MLANPKHHRALSRLFIVGGLIANGYGGRFRELVLSTSGRIYQVAEDRSETFEYIVKLATHNGPAAKDAITRALQIALGAAETNPRNKA